MNKRIIAVLSVLIVVLSASFAGCGKKVTQEDKTTTDSDKIVLNGDYEDIPEGSEIVIGADGQSYLVDGDGNSVVYEAPSAYVIPNANPVPVTPSSQTTKPTVTTAKPTTTIKVIPSTTTTTTTSQQEGIIKTLTPLRIEGYNDSEARAKLTNSNFDHLDVKFVDGKDNDWLFEFHKGAYGSSTVGCEAGFYTRQSSNNGYKKVSDQAGIVCKAQLYNGDNRITGFSETSVNSGWRYSFVNGGAKTSDLAMIVSVKLNFERMDAFTDALEEMGFAEGSTSSTRNIKNYSVVAPEETGKPYVVTFVW